MTAFFLPKLGRAGDAEETYKAMRRGVEDDTGQRPLQRRILRLWSRRDGGDHYTEVGRPDPIHGGTVLAIFDLGPHEPYVVQRDGVREVLSNHAYDVVEFES